MYRPEKKKLSSKATENRMSITSIDSDRSRRKGDKKKATGTTDGRVRTTTAAPTGKLESYCGNGVIDCPDDAGNNSSMENAGKILQGGNFDNTMDNIFKGIEDLKTLSDDLKNKDAGDSDTPGSSGSGSGTGSSGSGSSNDGSQPDTTQPTTQKPDTTKPAGMAPAGIIEDIKKRPYISGAIGAGLLATGIYLYRKN